MKPARSPLFSIITVTYNAAATINATLDSVREQTFEDYEHLIIDGASADSTVEIVNSYNNAKTVVISEKDDGIYDAMNKGLSIAKGEYLIFMNAGDRFPDPRTLSHYASAITENDYPGIVYGQTRLVDINGNYVGERHLKAPERLTLDSFKNGMVVCHQAMAVNHKIALLFNRKYKYSSDYEWVIVCLQHSRKNVYLKENTVDYLCEGATTTHHKDSLYERYCIMCTYYGTIPTLLRHIKFAFRYLIRRRNAKTIQ
ncbi:MAG: glycosyltransferase [Muribaculaceae bacterium]|nr:glycosyltransferase [Muribaculaceae bacterium]